MALAWQRKCYNCIKHHKNQQLYEEKLTVIKDIVVFVFCVFRKKPPLPSLQNYYDIDLIDM